MKRLNNWTVNFLGLICFGLLISCVKMPLTESRWVQKSEEEKSFRFYDPKSRIRYDIENDASHIYITMDVMHTGTKLRMLRTGTRISFAPAGKRKSSMAIEFPLVDDSTPIEMDPTEHDMMPRNGSSHELSKLLPKEGYFLSGDSVRIPIPAGIDSDDFLIRMNIDPDGALIYTAKIPLVILNLQEDEFSVGFETGAFNIDDPEYEKQLQSTGAEGLDRSAGFNQNRNMSGGSGLGINQPYGNVGQPGMNNQQMGSVPPRLGQRSALSDPIFFWVRTKLDPSISR
ncbi:MAG: hypothetical protein ACI85F_001263 [Bacteroidia bacterium]|jgi:hypothetical protein